MKYTTKEILLHFLKEYESILEDMSEKKINPFLKNFLVRNDLIDIIKTISDRVRWERIELENMPIQKLWDMIPTDRVVLNYYLQQWQSSLQKQEAITPESVQETLAKSSSQTSYLAVKPIEDWDEYDHSNYRSKLIKSGRIKCLYGVYFRYISQEKVATCTTHPKRLFDTWEEANSHLKDKILEGNVKNHEVHILYVYRAV